GKATRDLADRPVPARSLPVDLGVEQPPFEPDRLTQMHAFGAQPALIGRVPGIARDRHFALAGHGRANSAADTAIGARGADRPHGAQAAFGCPIGCAGTTASRSRSMRPASTLTGLAGTQAPASSGPSPSVSPLRSEMRQLGSGQVTLSPWTMPWLSGPCLCGHLLTRA